MRLNRAGRAGPGLGAASEMFPHPALLSSRGFAAGLRHWTRRGCCGGSCCGEPQPRVASRSGEAACGQRPRKASSGKL
jgi:hypothetical protein